MVQELLVPLAGLNVQELLLKLPLAPAVEFTRSRPKLTVPAGADCVPLSVSVTVTRHRLPWLSATGAAHERLVLLLRSWTLSPTLPELD